MEARALFQEESCSKGEHATTWIGEKSSNEWEESRLGMRREEMEASRFFPFSPEEKVRLISFLLFVSGLSAVGPAVLVQCRIKCLIV